MARTVIVIDDAADGGVQAEAHFERPMTQIDEAPTNAETAAAALMASAEADLIDYKALDAGVDVHVAVPQAADADERPATEAA